MTPLTEIRAYEPRGVYERWIVNREVIYLDNNMWIDLADAQSAHTRRTAEALCKLVAQRRIVCPLSFAAVSELIDQPSDLRRARRARLMDALSDGVVLRNSVLVRDAELLELQPGGKLADCRREVFSLLLDYLGDYSLTPADESEVALKLAEFVRDYLSLNAEARSLNRFLELSCISEMRERHAQEMKKYLRESVKGFAATRQDIVLNKLSSADVLHRVRQHIFNTWFVSKVLDKNSPIPPPQDRRTLTRLFRRLPTTNLMAEIFTARYCNLQRTPQAQDFFDTEHALAAIYCDVFATNDGNLFSILSGAKSIGSIVPCRLLRGVKALGSHLEKQHAVVIEDDEP